MNIESTVKYLKRTCINNHTINHGDDYYINCAGCGQELMFKLVNECNEFVHNDNKDCFAHICTQCGKHYPTKGKQGGTYPLRHRNCEFTAKCGQCKKQQKKKEFDVVENKLEEEEVKIDDNDDNVENKLEEEEVKINQTSVPSANASDAQSQPHEFLSLLSGLQKDTNDFYARITDDVIPNSCPALPSASDILQQLNFNMENDATDISQHLNRLNESLNFYKKCYQQKQQELMILKERCINLESENNVFKRKIIYLSNEFELLDENNNYFMKRTSDCNELKKLIATNHTNNCLLKVPLRFKHLHSDIEKFIELNGEYLLNPQVTFPNGDKWELNKIFIDCQTVNSQEFGIKSTLNMPANVILSQCVGIEYLQEEVINKYIPNKNIFKLPIDYNDKKHHLIIDCHVYKDDTRCIISNIRRCSSNANANGIFLPILLKGWPTVFVITTKDIQKNEELLCCFEPM